MKLRELYVGAVVYHTLFPHWGRGVVEQMRRTDNLGLVTARRALVRWDGGVNNNPAWMRASELRKTPKS